MNNYDDIINLKRPISKRESMSLENRAAQFAPFSALSGYSEACREVERITDNKKILCDGIKEEINEKLNFINSNIKNIGDISCEYFVKDNRKKGGSYRDYVGKVKKVDINKNCLTFVDGTIINFFDIYSICGEDFLCFDL
jgi:hypothetical protein